MFGSVRRVVARLGGQSRFGRKKAFSLAIGLALLALPVTEALAYFSATGTGTISNIQAGTASSTVTIAANGAPIYAGPSTTSLVPAGTVQQGVVITCTAQPPCVIPSLSLQSWSSNKAGCTSALMPGSFTVTAHTATYPITINALNGTASDSPTITWNNLAAIDQTPCAGGLFSFVLSVP